VVLTHSSRKVGGRQDLSLERGDRGMDHGSERDKWGSEVPGSILGLLSRLLDLRHGQWREETKGGSHPRAT
jgi:hypothetical protein